MQTWLSKCLETIAAIGRYAQFYAEGSDPLVYEFKKHDMVVNFTLRDDTKRIVQLALGSETRTFELEEFTDFWLTMIEEGRKATTAYLESLGELSRKKNGKKERSNSHT